MMLPTKAEENKEINHAVADIGGTNARFAIITHTGKVLTYTETI